MWFAVRSCVLCRSRFCIQLMKQIFSHLVVVASKGVFFTLSDTISFFVSNRCQCCNSVIVCSDVAVMVDRYCFWVLSVFFHEQLRMPSSALDIATRYQRYQY